MQTTTQHTTKTRQTQTKQAKRIVFITGDKGGTGKSSFARGLLDIYQHADIPCQAYDSDRRNPQLYRHYAQTPGGVDEIDIITTGKGDDFLAELDTNQPDLVLVDLPAGAGEWFEQWEQELGLIEDVALMGYRVTMVSVISRVKDAVNSLRILLDCYDRRIDYVVVKNLYFGQVDQFKRFDSSHTRELLQELDAIEIAMPDLFDDAYDTIDQHDLSFREALAEGSPLSRANRSRVCHWLRKLEAEVQKADHYLGLKA
jgi:hypothetical protein